MLRLPPPILTTLSKVCLERRLRRLPEAYTEACTGAYVNAYVNGYASKLYLILCFFPISSGRMGQCPVKRLLDMGNFNENSSIVVLLWSAGACIERVRL